MRDVVFVPYSEQNEYHNLLTAALADHDVQTHKGTTRAGFGSREELLGLLFPLVRFAFDPEVDIDIVHVVWTGPLFLQAGYTPSKTVNRALSIVRGTILILNAYVLRLFGIRIVWTVHNKYNHEKDHVTINLAVNKLFATACDALTVECEHAKTIVSDAFGVQAGKISVIPEGNYIDAYPNDVTRGEARKRLGLPSDATVIVNFGRIRPYKGVPQLVKAYKTVRTVDSHLLIAGSPMDEEIRQDVLRRTNMEPDITSDLQFIPNDEVQLYMNAADIVALPYRDILTSGSALLAASFGRPVVAPAMGCVPAVVQREGGLLYDSEDADELEDALQNGLKSDNLDAIGVDNRRRAESLSWSDVAEQTAELYDAVTRA
ncbi:glycosyltransferase [Halosimplex rubrum]|uniref:Glycosyltransferase n=1 Tax=Halosimplex rubrum TaxID=869889 RepID=A0A7D5TMV4_9EURY|nr:glycosyltransferase [Halosimplex rubrum]QLH76834.1 glycosyltransferase [Halosimplex rubrum]